MSEHASKRVRVEQRFELSSRGRILSLTPVPIGDGHIEFKFLSTAPESGV